MGMFVESGETIFQRLTVVLGSEGAVKLPAFCVHLTWLYVPGSTSFPGRVLVGWLACLSPVTAYPQWWAGQAVITGLLSFTWIYPQNNEVREWNVDAIDNFFTAPVTEDQHSPRIRLLVRSSSTPTEDAY